MIADTVKRLPVKFDELPGGLPGGGRGRSFSGGWSFHGAGTLQDQPGFRKQEGTLSIECPGIQDVEGVEGVLGGGQSVTRARGKQGQQGGGREKERTVFPSFHGLGGS